MQNRSRLTDTENKLVPTEGQKVEEGASQGQGLTDMTTMHTTDEQQGYIVQHRELQPLSYNNLEYNLQKYWISVLYT